MGEVVVDFIKGERDLLSGASDYTSFRKLEAAFSFYGAMIYFRFLPQILKIQGHANVSEVGSHLSMDSVFFGDKFRSYGHINFGGASCCIC